MLTNSFIEALFFVQKKTRIFDTDCDEWFNFESKKDFYKEAAKKGFLFQKRIFFRKRTHSVLFLGNPPQKLKILYTSNILYPAKTSPYNYSTYREKYENNSFLEVSPKFWPFFLFLLLNPM